MSGPPIQRKKTALLDRTAVAHRMPKGSCLLYPNPNRNRPDPASYVGVIVTDQGFKYWVGAWGRTVAGRTVIEIRMTPKQEPAAAK